MRKKSELLNPIERGTLKCYRAKHPTLITHVLVLYFIDVFLHYFLNSVGSGPWRGKKRLEWRGIWLLALDTTSSDGGKSHTVIDANTSCRPFNAVSELLTAERSVKTFTPVNGQARGRHLGLSKNDHALQSERSARHLKLAFLFC